MDACGLRQPLPSGIVSIFSLTSKEKVADYRIIVGCA
jgi:hypothetical protein